MACSVAGGAAGFEFGGDRSAGLFVGRVVVVFEEVGALAIDAFASVSLQHDAFLSGRGMPPTC